MPNKIFIPILIVVLFSAVIFITQKSHQEKNITPTTIVKISKDKCAAQIKSCNIKIDEFNINVSLDKNIYYLKPFSISVSIESNSANQIKSIQVDFKMKNMNMGVNRFVLEKAAASHNISMWQGKALLPICVTGRADWVLEMYVVTKNNLYVISLPVDIKK